MSTPVLERFNWRRVGPAAWVRLPGETVIDTFATRADAHTEQARREAETRALVGHPFRCGTTVGELTTLPEYAFLDWLRDADVEPPDLDPDGRRPWLAWADLYSGEWTPAQLAHIWEGANRVRFCRVRERVGEVLRCVVRLNWWQDMNDTNYLPPAEGGVPVGVWADHMAAIGECVRVQQLAAAEVAAALQSNGEEWLRFDPTRRAEADRPFDVVLPTAVVTADHATHCGLCEVQRGEPELRLPVPPLGPEAFVVVRWNWDTTIDEGSVTFEHRPEAGGVPVRVFAAREPAERYAEEQRVAARELMNPYRLWCPDFFGVRQLTPELLKAARTTGNPLYAIDEAQVVGTAGDWSIPLSEWWDRVTPTLSPEQVVATWEACQPLRFYDVVPVRVADARPPRRVRTLYYVRATNWAPGGGPGHNPHRFLGAFADRSRAERVRDEAERRFRESPPPEVGLPMASEEDRPWEAFSSMTQPQAWQHLVHHWVIGGGGDSRFVPYPHWREQLISHMTPRQRKALWQVFDRVWLYEVLAIETEVGE